RLMPMAGSGSVRGRGPITVVSAARSFDRAPSPVISPAASSAARTSSVSGSRLVREGASTAVIFPVGRGLDFPLLDPGAGLAPFVFLLLDSGAGLAPFVFPLLDSGVGLAPFARFRRA